MSGHLLGIADEYGSIWTGEPGASERIGDLVQRPDEETFEIRLGETARSPESYEREIRSLETRLSEECANSLRLANKLGDVAAAWFAFRQSDLDALLHDHRRDDD